MEFIVHSDQEMSDFGRRLASRLKPGDIIELVGDVGAGKTTLTRGIARGLGIKDPVQSPTFTIQRVYESPQHIRLVHYDFYRLNDAGVMRDELQDTLNTHDSIVIIEWGDIINGVLPPDHIRVQIEALSENERRVRIEGDTK